MASSTHRIRIHASQDIVFQALSTEEGLKGWYTSRVEGDIAEGKTASFVFPKDETFRWKFVELQPERIEWTCEDGPGAAKGTRVLFALNRVSDDQTILTCEHTGWPDGHDALATCNTLWGIVMGHLRDYAQSRIPVPAYRS